ncbi:MAG: hypothetical protein M3324_10325 [Actinomycetota bacterium]|nr:hypothetical protein [Actinomycetota bacterium]
MTDQTRQEQHTEQAIKVRQVTDVHANWSTQERGEPGKFSYQLILDDGAEEFVIRVPADDAKVLRDLFHDADTIYFDMQRQVLIFGETT